MLKIEQQSGVEIAYAKKNIRSFSELKSELTDQIFGIGVEVGVAKKRFSKSESTFGIKKLDSTGL